jgi:adenylate cyclase
MREKRAGGRRLAAILAADVAGYSRLTRADEEGTIARLRTLRRELIDPAIDAHGGRIIKTMGDGLLIEFASAVDAVRCAVSIQRSMVPRNEAAPEEKRIVFRVGINVGDVVIEGDGDLMGDGINVASRLEGQAEPGGICLSGAAYEQVRDKLALAFADLGERSLKNIDRPVHIHGLAADALPPAPEISDQTSNSRIDKRFSKRNLFAMLSALVAALLLGGGGWLTFRSETEARGSMSPPPLSMMVLPFTNLNGDPAQAYLADVLTEQLTTSLSRLHGTFVIAASTAFTYKGKPIDVRRIGKELNIRYVVEGSEQHDQNDIRVSAQLIDTQSQANLWADQFDANRADMLLMQDQIVTRLARALQIQLLQADTAHIAAAGSANSAAEDLAMRCEAIYLNYGPFRAETQKGYDLCEDALKIDPHNSRASSILGHKYATRLLNFQSTDVKADLQRGRELVAQALAVDPNSYQAHHIKALLLTVTGPQDQAIVEAERALELNPSYVPAYAALCNANLYLGHASDVIRLADKAMLLSPRDPQLYVFYLERGLAQFMLQKYGDAVLSLRGTLAAAPGFTFGHALLAGALAESGDVADAKVEMSRYLGSGQTKTVDAVESQTRRRCDSPLCNDFATRFGESLRKAGMPQQ